MSLPIFILLPLLGAFAAWLASAVNKTLPRWVALLVMLAGLALSAGMWWQVQNDVYLTGDHWLQTYELPWMPRFGISFSLALDGLSLLMLVLTFFLGALSVMVSWNEIKERSGFFHFNLLFVIGGITGVFLTMDLFLFYFFWEVMLIPMYFLIGIWGHGNRVYAAFKFFLFTRARR